MTAVISKVSHPWDVSPAEAVGIQKKLRGLIVEEPLSGVPRFIAGTDVSYDIGSERHAAVVMVLRYPDLQLVEWAAATGRVTFPYVPGLLSFREVPLLLEAFAKLKTEPDLVFCDGQGRAHPRRFGIACHLGILLDKPSLGVGKTRLCGQFEPPGEEKGRFSELRDRGELVGRVLRTRAKVAPVFVSVGHRITLEQATDFVLKCAVKYRIPEPTRQAHAVANRLRAGEDTREKFLFNLPDSR